MADNNVRASRTKTTRFDLTRNLVINPLNPIPEYYFDYIKHYSDLNNNIQQALAQEIYPIFTVELSGIDFESFVGEEKIYRDKADQIGIILIKNSSDHKTIGFVTFTTNIFYADENVFTPENTYIVLSGLGVVSSKFKGKKILKHFMNFTKWVFDTYYPNSNCILFDISINPITYNFCCGDSELLIPSYKEKGFPKMYELMKKS